MAKGRPLRSFYREGLRRDAAREGFGARGVWRAAWGGTRSTPSLLNTLLGLSLPAFVETDAVIGARTRATFREQRVLLLFAGKCTRSALGCWRA